jgi:hypothetical protein
MFQTKFVVINEYVTLMYIFIMKWVVFKILTTICKNGPQEITNLLICDILCSFLMLVKLVFVFCVLSDWP